MSQLVCLLLQQLCSCDCATLATVCHIQTFSGSSPSYLIFNPHLQNLGRDSIKSNPATVPERIPNLILQSLSEVGISSTFVQEPQCAARYLCPRNGIDAITLPKHLNLTAAVG